MRKVEYKKPLIKVVKFITENIITTSGMTSGHELKTTFGNHSAGESVGSVKLADLFE